MVRQAPMKAIPPRPAPHAVGAHTEDFDTRYESIVKEE